METSKAVVLLSGGMDSTTTLAYAKNIHHEVYPISFNYGQRHKLKELEAARKVCGHYGLSYKEVDLSSLQGVLAGSALTTDSIEVPEGHYEESSMRSTVVPNRNAILLSIAFGYAVSLGASTVYGGVHAGDHAIYPDCREEFIDALNQALQLGNEGYMPATGIMIETPYVDQTKAVIVLSATGLEAPLHLTWSCYKGGEIHCGKCGTCVERREAFQVAGVVDPTVYQD